jgi:hypothetical protein
MTIESFQNAGTKRSQIDFTDEELKEQIDVLEAMISYFESRKDAGFILASLYIELGRFNNIGFHRSFKTVFDSIPGLCESTQL